MKVAYIGPDLVSVEKNKAYDVISIEKGWYRIMTELDESYLFPPEVLRVLNEDDESLFGGEGVTKYYASFKEYREKRCANQRKLFSGRLRRKRLCERQYQNRESD